MSRSALHAIAALALAGLARPAAAQEPVPTPPARVQVRIPADTTIPWPDGRLPIVVRGTRGALVTVTIVSSDAGARRLLSQALPVGVSATVWWNARETESPLAPSGRYLLRVAVVDEAGAATTALERVLLVSRVPADTTAEPPPLDTSAFLPERATVRMGDPLPMLSGIVTGVAAAFLPELLSRPNLRPSAGGNGWRLGVAGVAIAAGIFGFVTSEGPQPLAENITTNRALRDQDARDRVLLRDANARAREAAPVRIRAEESAP